MVDLAVDLARRYRFSTQFTQMAISDFLDSDWTFTPERGGNHATWMIAHLAFSRRTLARMLGADIAKADWEAKVVMGVASEPANNYPSPGEMLEDFQETGRILDNKLTEGSAEELNKSLEKPFPDGSETVLQAVGFMYMHESYHIGQLGYIRRLLGKPSIEKILMKAMAGQQS